jgi:[ribosomal protein S5]-alanine N-acetyltransferase
MKLVVEICTKRLRISNFLHSDISEEYVSWLNNRQLMQYSEQRHCQHTVESCEDYLQGFKAGDDLFLAIRSHQGELLGSVTVYQDRNNSLVDMGILVGAPSAQGIGVGKEAWSSVVEWVFGSIRPRKLTAGCMSVNLPMIRLMESVGMQADGIRKNHYLWNGEVVDVVYMAKYQ